MAASTKLIKRKVTKKVLEKKSFSQLKIDEEKNRAKEHEVEEDNKKGEEEEMEVKKEAEILKFEDFQDESEQENVGQSDEEEDGGEAGGDESETEREMEKVHTKMQGKEKKGKKEIKKSNKIGKGNVIYLGRIPHGFYEQEMMSYFSQFGEILNLRLSRNKKTGASKHYAFIQFASPAVAEIVVETMHNYLLSNRLLQCHLLDDDQVHPNLFIGAGVDYKPLPWNKIERQRHHKLKTPEEFQRQVKRLTKKRSKKMQLLKSLGIDFDPNQDDGVPINEEIDDKVGGAVAEPIVGEKLKEEENMKMSNKNPDSKKISKKEKSKSGKVSKKVKPA